jgi:hypothetical protein
MTIGKTPRAKNEVNHLELKSKEQGPRDPKGCKKDEIWKTTSSTNA